MASGSTLATLLAGLKANAAAVAVAGTVVVGGGAAAAAVATGAVHLPGQATVHGQSTETSSNQGTDGAAARLQACTQHSGDAQRLVLVYGPLFKGDKATAQDEICGLFVGSDGHAFGFGEVQEVLDIAAGIEARDGSSACLTTPLAAAAPGKPSDAGAPSATVPTQTAPGVTTGLIQKIMQAAQSSPLLQLAQNCNISFRPDAASAGSAGADGSGSAAGGKPTETPGAKPTGTPGRP